MEEINKNTSTVNRDLFYILIILLLVLFGLFQCDRIRDLKEDKKINDQNQKAILDSVRIIKNKFGEDISVKNVLISDNKELKTLNKSLSADLKRIVGKVKYISSVVTELKNVDTVYLTNTIREFPDGTKELSWKYEKNFDSTNSRLLEGNSRFLLDTSNKTFKIVDKGTTITKDEMRIKLTTGLTELDNSYQIFVKTDYPGVKFDKIDGSVLDKNMLIKPKEPTTVIGPSVSAGMALNPFTFQLQPQISLGVSYTLNVNKYIRKIKNFFK